MAKGRALSLEKKWRGPLFKDPHVAGTRAVAVVITSTNGQPPTISAKSDGDAGEVICCFSDDVRTYLHPSGILPLEYLRVTGRA